MENNKFRSFVQKIGFPPILLIISTIIFIVSLIGVNYGLWSGYLIIAVLAFGTTVCSAGTLLLSLLMKKSRKKKSHFFYFIITDVFLVLLAAGYGIYDMLTDTGMMPGILGYLILCFVVPMLIGLGVLSWVIHLIIKHCKKKT